MYNKAFIPDVTYQVTMMDHSICDLEAAAFHGKLADTNFINKIQMFKRFLWQFDGKQVRHHELDQEPCLIVKKVVPESDFDRYESPDMDSLYDLIRSNRVYSPDHFMIAYDNTAEPIVTGTKLFNRNLDLLYPQTAHNLQIQNRITNGVSFSLARAQRSQALN